eukprot:11294119-Ditylum_brightwellii.AAC.1
MRWTGLFNATRSTSVVISVRGQAAIAREDKENDNEGGDNTMPPRKEIVHRHQDQETSLSLTNYYLVTTLDQKMSHLVSFLKQRQGEKAIVFFLICECVEFYDTTLSNILSSLDKYYIECLHGEIVQK